MRYSNISESSPGFMGGVGVALVMSVFAALSHSVFGWLLPISLMGYLLVIALGLAYLLYLLSRSRHKTGRLTTVALYIVIAMSMTVTGMSMTWLLIVVLAMVWLVRSLYFYNSLLSALLDMGLTLISVSIAVAAWLHTDSLFLFVWCLMLVQACFIWIPADWRPKKTVLESIRSSDRFDRALRAAKSASQKLASQSSN